MLTKILPGMGGVEKITILSSILYESKYNIMYMKYVYINE